MRSPIMWHRCCSLCHIVWIQTRIPVPPCYPSSSIFSCFTSLQLLSVVADGYSTPKDSSLRKSREACSSDKHEPVIFGQNVLFYGNDFPTLGRDCVRPFIWAARPLSLTMSTMSPFLRTQQIIDQAAPRCQAGRLPKFRLPSAAIDCHRKRPPDVPSASMIFTRLPSQVLRTPESPATHGGRASPRAVRAESPVTHGGRASPRAARAESPEHMEGERPREP